MIAALAGFLLPVAAAWLLLGTLRSIERPLSRATRAGLALAFGIGVPGVVTFWCSVMQIELGTRFAAVDATGWTLAVAAAWWLVARPHDGVVARRRSNRSDWLIRLLFAAVVLVVATTVIRSYVLAPHGIWDAWAIWNQKARFISRAPAGWQAMLGISWSNPSHPFLVSLSVARLWAYAGTETTVVPALLSAAWGVGITLLVMGALDTRRWQAWAGGAAVVAPGIFGVLAAGQTADLAVAMFITAAVVLLRLALAEPAPASRPYLLLAGALGGIAAITKNEGLLFAGAATLVAIVALLRRRPTDLAWWFFGAIPMSVAIVWFKLVLAPVAPEYMAGGMDNGSALGRLLAADRHAQVLSLVATLALEWSGRFASGALPAALAAAIVGTTRRPGRREWPLLAIVLSMMAGYYAVWVVSPLDTPWLVRSTFDRLLMQIWPSLVIVALATWDPAADADEVRGSTV